MIRLVRIQNLRACRDVTLQLEPLTVLVGPNGSGKSTLIDALNVAREFNPGEDSWRHSGAGIQIHFQYSDGTFLNRGWQRASHNPTHQQLSLDVGRMRQAETLQLVTQLGKNGEGLTNLFDGLSRKERAIVAERFCSLVPTFSDVDRIAAGEGMHYLRFQDRWSPDVWYRPHEVSDGSILVLAFLLLPYQKPQPELIAIEDPEHGLHPYLLEALMDLLRKLSSGDFGAPVQVVVATHSPQILEYARPEEVRFVDRSEATGEVSVREPPTKDEEWRPVFEAYQRSLGSIWLSGNLGGVPGA